MCVYIQDTRMHNTTHTYIFIMYIIYYMLYIIKQKKKILPFILTFNPNNPKTLSIIKQTLENLKT